jgi:hypothetical protein
MATMVRPVTEKDIPRIRAVEGIARADARYCGLPTDTAFSKDYLLPGYVSLVVVVDEVIQGYFVMWTKTEGPAICHAFGMNVGQAGVATWAIALVREMAKQLQALGFKQGVSEVAPSRLAGARTFVTSITNGTFSGNTLVIDLAKVP